MTVGFENAGLLSLQQAIGVVFGANIGTTINGPDGVVQARTGSRCLRRSSVWCC
jgi:hypothetical protein